MPAVSIDPPYTVAELPSCVNGGLGRYLVSDVYGGSPGTRKRRRAELVIGIPGESINLYDTLSSRLITSYALPPHSSLTCPPCSIRLRKDGKTSFERRSYTSITGESTNITLFKATEDLKPVERTIKHELSKPENKVVFIGIVPEGGQDNLLLVREDGEVQCLNGQDLTPLWTSSAASKDKDSLGLGEQHETLEMCRLTGGESLKHSLFRDRPDIMTIVNERAHESTNILLFVTCRVDGPLKDKRTLRVLLLPQQQQSITYRSRTLQNLLTVDIPWIHDRAFEVLLPIKYDFHAGSGCFYELVDSKLSIFALNDSMAKLKSQLLLGDRPSFKRLSPTSIATSSSDSIAIWNPRFNSVQAVLPLAEEDAKQPGKKRKLINTSRDGYELVSSSPKNSQVHAIKDGFLVAFGTNLRQERAGRRRPTGLLIDSLGCGASTANDDDQSTKDHKSVMDGAATAQDVATFEAHVAKLFGLPREDQNPNVQRSTGNTDKNAIGAPLPAGNHAQNGGVNGTSAASWVWPSELLTYPGIGEKWLTYLLRKIFSWKKHPNETPKNGFVGMETLDVEFFPYNVVRWLIEGGRLTVATIESAFRQELMASHHRHLPAGCLVSAVVAMDPELRLLLLLLSNTYLEARELMHATRILMESFDLWDAPAPENRLALTDGEPENGNLEEELERLVEDTAEDLQLAEFQLGEDNSTKGQALSLALLKLHRSPSSTIVNALQSELTSREVISLIYLLRFELARGSWTSRYLDVNQFSDDTPSQERNILLISDLLNNCVDAVGSGGWLSGDAMLVRDDHQGSEELISSLKLEVSAALEGIQEAQYLRGLTTEMMRYSQAVQSGLPAKRRKVDTTVETKVDLVRRNNVPMLIELTGSNPSLLPYGLKVEQQISLVRVGAGGEVTRRSMRDIGRLKSKKVGTYTLERILI